MQIIFIIIYLSVNTSYNQSFLLMCLRYDIIHIVLRTMFIQICYLRCFFIILDVGQCKHKLNGKYVEEIIIGEYHVCFSLVFAFFFCDVGYI